MKASCIRIIFFIPILLLFLGASSMDRTCERLQAACYGKLASSWLEGQANWRELPAYHVNECVKMVSRVCSRSPVCVRAGALPFDATMNLTDGQTFRAVDLRCAENTHYKVSRENPYYPDVMIIRQRCQSGKIPSESQIIFDEKESYPAIYYCNAAGDFRYQALQGVFEAVRNDGELSCNIHFEDGTHLTVPPAATAEWGENQKNSCLKIEETNRGPREICFMKFQNDGVRCRLFFAIR